MTIKAGKRPKKPKKSPWFVAATPDDNIAEWVKSNLSVLDDIVKRRRMPRFVRTDEYYFRSFCAGIWVGLLTKDSAKAGRAQQSKVSGGMEPFEAAKTTVQEFLAAQTAAQTAV